MYSCWFMARVELPKIYHLGVYELLGLGSLWVIGEFNLGAINWWGQPHRRTTFKKCLIKLYIGLFSNM